jgi:serine protease Do
MYELAEIVGIHFGPCLNNLFCGSTMMSRFCGWLLVMAIFSLTLSAQDRDTKVRNDKAKVSADERWLYNQPEQGMQVAQQTKKPVLLVFRCIPCEACSKFDEQVLQRDPAVAALLDQFVCVRVPQMNGVDLSKYQFDYDMSLAVFFLHGDGTILGRFGTRTGRDNEEQDMHIAGFADACKNVLALHQNYDQVKASLAGKQSLPAKITTPEQYPSLKPKFTDKLNYEGAVAKSCIHCHNVREAERQLARSNGEPWSDQLLYPWPSPRIVGLSFDPQTATTLREVPADSAAAKAGLQAGDRVLELAGQPIVSVADVQWILHHTAAEKTMLVKLQRGQEQKTVSLQLMSGWRQTTDIAWRATSWDLRRMVTGGLVFEELTKEDRATLKLPADQLALRVKHAGMYGEHAQAKNAGVQKGDIITRWAGKNEPWRESDLLTWSLMNLKPGQQYEIEYRRGEQSKSARLTAK